MSTVKSPETSTPTQEGITAFFAALEHNPSVTEFKNLEIYKALLKSMIEEIWDSIPRRWHVLNNREDLEGTQQWDSSIRTEASAYARGWACLPDKERTSIGSTFGLDLGNGSTIVTMTTAGIVAWHRYIGIL